MSYLCLGMTFTASGTGGEYKHTLTIAELAKHDHKSYGAYMAFGNGPGSMTGEQKSSTSLSGDKLTMDTGSSSPHNNMPPYRGVYFWHRTA